MAEGADGRVEIDAVMNTDGMKNSSKEIVAALKSVQSSIQSMSTSISAMNSKLDGSAKRQTKSYKETEETVESLNEKLERSKAELEEVRNTRVTSEDFVEQQKRVDKAEASLNKLYNRLDRYTLLGRETPPALKLDIKDAEENLARAERGLESLRDQGREFTIGNPEKEASISEYIKEVESKIIDLKVAEEERNQEASRASTVQNVLQEEAQAAEEAKNKYALLKNTISFVGDSFRNFGSNLRTISIQGLKKLGSAIPTAAFNLGRKAVNAFSSALRTMGSIGKSLVGGFLGNLKNSLSGIRKHAEKGGTSLKRMIMAGLGFRSVFALVRKLRTFIVGGFNNLAKYSTAFNKSMSAFKSSASELKNNLAAAFEPIANAIIPALTSLINWLNTAIATLSKFFALISGKSFYTKAKKQTIDYASSLDSASSSADGALASFDKLQVLNDSSGSGGGEATGANAFETVDISDEEMPFTSWGDAFSQFLDYLNTNGIPLLQSALSTAATKVNEFSSKLYEMFTFEGVDEKVKTLATNISESFNNFVQLIDWSTLGGALGAGLNLAILFLTETIYTFDWKALGDKLADAFNSFISEIDWSNVGELLWSKFKIVLETAAGFLENVDMVELATSLSEVVIGLFDSISDTLKNIDWAKLGEQVKDFLVNIDWSGIATSVFTVIGNAFGALASFLWGLLHDAWEDIVSWWQEAAFEDGEFDAQGLLDGITSIFTNIKTWIKEHIFDPFMEGFKNVFGIHSPSTVMKEMGIYLMQGLLNGITSLISKITAKFTTLKNSITNIWKKVKESTTNIWNGISDSIKDTINTIIGFINGMMSAIVSGVNKVIDILNSLSWTVPDWVPELGGSTFGFNVAKVTAPQIPLLAQGAVLPANNPFLAVLGDQKSGRNLEAPEGLIRQILQEELSKSYNSGEVIINASGDMSQFIKLLKFELQKENRRVGTDFTVRVGGA